MLTPPPPAPSCLPDPALLSAGMVSSARVAAQAHPRPDRHAPSLPEHLEAALWRGNQIGRSAAPTCPSGFAALDAELPGGGWPTAALTELLLASPGQGELRLLGPVGAALAGRPLVWVAPPHRPYSPALRGLGWAPEQLLWIDPADPADAAWAAEQAVKSRSCGAVLWWAPQARPEQLRRLHLAAQGGETLLFVLRPPAAAVQSSPAPLRLQVQADPLRPGGLQLQLLKRRGPALDTPLHLDARTLFAPALARRLARPLPRWPDVPARPGLPVRLDVAAGAGSGQADAPPRAPQALA